MDLSKVAYTLHVLFDSKIMNYYHASYKGEFGKVQLEVLGYLYEHKESRTQEVANALAIPKQHASKIILRLQDLGLVENKKDDIDKRAMLYYLSEEGFTLVHTHIKDSNADFEKKLEKLSEEEKEALHQGMQSIIAILQKL